MRPRKILSKSVNRVIFSCKNQKTFLRGPPVAFLCAGHGFQERFLAFLCAGHGFQERFLTFLCASIRPRGGLTLYVFLLRSCCAYPTWLGRAGTERKQQQHDSVVQGPPCHHRAQGSSVNPFGYPPLSDISPKLIYTSLNIVYISCNIIYIWSTLMNNTQK